MRCLSLQHPIVLFPRTVGTFVLPSPSLPPWEHGNTFPVGSPVDKLLNWGNTLPKTGKGISSREVNVRQTCVCVCVCVCMCVCCT